MTIIEITKAGEVFKSFDDCTLKAAKLRAEVLNQKEDTDEYSARVKPEQELEAEVED